MSDIRERLAVVETEISHVKETQKDHGEKLDLIYNEIKIGNDNRELICNERHEKVLTLGVAKWLGGIYLTAIIGVAGVIGTLYYKYTDLSVAIAKILEKLQ